MRTWLILLPVFLVILISGCTNIENLPIEQIATSNPVVAAYMTEHPSAEFSFKPFTEQQMELLIGDIRADCGNPEIEVKKYYRLLVQEEGSNEYVVAWLDLEEGKLLCDPVRKELGPTRTGTSDDECSEVDTRSCGNNDEGECKFGTEFCVNGKWSETCEGEIKPTDEIWNGLDDDCDAEVDEDFNCKLGETDTCGTDVGACWPGTFSCVDGEWNEICEGEVKSTTEICDAYDNDCDGEVNEDDVCEGNPDSIVGGWLDQSASPAGDGSITTVITGPSRVSQGVYTMWQLAVSDSSDPNGNVYYRLYWGDGTSFVFSLLSGQTWEIGHAYSDNKMYQISVDVTRADGTVIKKPVLDVEVIKNLPPTNLSITGPTTAILGERWIIGPNSWRIRATDPEGGKMSYRLDCGGSDYKSGQSPLGLPLDTLVSCGWAETGTYTLSLRVEDSEGFSSTKTFPVTVIEKPVSENNSAPVIEDNALTTPTSVIAGTVNAWWYEVSDPDGDIISMLFDWGDDSTLRGSGKASVSGSAHHTYTETGEYTLMLTVTDNGGLSDTKSLEITVIPVTGVSTKFSVGNQVRSTADLILARQLVPRRILAGLQARGITGTVIEGPTFSHNNWWWNVDFNSGPDGWAPEPWIQKTSETLPENPIIFSSPAAGSVWRVGETHTITWTAPPLPALPNGVFVKLREEGQIFGTIALSVPQEINSYTWTIPQAMYNRILEGNDYSTAIVDKDGTIFGYGPTFSILKPVGYTPGEMFEIGDRIEVVSGVGIYYTPNGNPRGTNDGFGTITDGPVLADDDYYWYEVDLDGGVDGWVIEDWIKKNDAV